jgi:hypothetical protein
VVWCILKCVDILEYGDIQLCKVDNGQMALANDALTEVGQ